jgi:U3 small nucleolar RNA-associated protein 25
MIQLLVKPGKGEVANKKKFFKLFGQDESNDSKLPEYKPDSYHHIFSGNIDDCFRVGLTVKKYHMNLFTPFYASDIIIASPLGLRTIIGGEGDKKRDYDFLSSIELVILSQADIFLMQNWDHVLHIFNHLHLQPVDGHGVDFSRVREWSLNCWCRYYSQLVLFCSFPTPEINSLFNSYARNYEGQVRVHAPLWVGSVNDIVWGAPQTLHRLKCSDHLQLPDIRFQYFINVIMPRLGDGAVSHVCIYIPSYFDYVRLRNHFTKEDHSFCHISEYSSNSDVSRARAYFKSGRKKFLLITERVHFFRRYHLTDIKNIVFYGPPTYCEFYPELINFMVNTDDSGRVILMYSKFDVLAMKRLLGNERTRTLINSTDNIHTLLID